MAQVVNRPKIPSERRTTTLFRGGEATSIARVFTRHFLLTVGRKDLVYDGELCVSELVGNAVRHTKSPIFVVNMYPNSGSPLFEVWDSSFKLPDWPNGPLFDDLGAEIGRGLGLVQVISKDCGAIARKPILGGGKFVWFRL